MVQLSKMQEQLWPNAKTPRAHEVFACIFISERNISLQVGELLIDCSPEPHGDEEGAVIDDGGAGHRRLQHILHPPDDPRWL